jgi:DNA repair exonuclease SbcCD ATPase subunit
MQIILKNYGCFENKTFQLDNNFILISGPSGRGKSTISKAISYVLYNKNKCTSWGKDSCSVELIYSSTLSIFRNKKPAKLSLTLNNCTYENDSAQDIINNIFGQNSLHENAFFQKKPADKLEFIEQIAFKNIDIDLLKQRANNFKNLNKSEWEKTMSKLDERKDIFKTMTEPSEVFFPIKTKDKETTAKNQHIKLRNTDKLIKRSRKIIDSSKKELSDLKVLNSLLSSLKEDIISLQSRKINSENEIPIDYVGDELFNNYKKQLSLIKKQQSFELLKQQYNDNNLQLEEMKKNEIHAYNQDLISINTEIEKLIDQTSVEESIQYNYECLDNIKQIQLLKKQLVFVDEKELNDNKIYLEEQINLLKEKQQLLNKIKLQKEIFSCPSCKHKLKIFNNSLILIETPDSVIDENIDDLKKNISTLTNNIKTLEKNISQIENNIQSNNKINIQINNIYNNSDNIDDLNNSPENIFELKEEIKILKNDLDSLKILKDKRNKINHSLQNNIFSSIYNSLLEKNLKIQKTIENDNNTYENFDLNEQELTAIIDKQEYYKNIVSKLKKDLNLIESDIKNKEKRLQNITNEYLESYCEIKKESELEAIISDEENNILTYEENKIQITENIKQIELYFKYIEELNIYNAFKDKIDELQIKENKTRKIYNASIYLKEKIMEAESIAIFNIVNSINSHMQLYLEAFFPDHPIMLSLVTFKETKNKNDKPQINIDIDYKGTDCKFDDLSDGEKSRVNLAFTLSLSEIFKNNILILDETCANLNQELTTIVFDTIKENFTNKKVIIIAHQIIEGIFDQILYL